MAKTQNVERKLTRGHLHRLVRPEREDAIHLGALSPETFHALKELSEAATWPELHAYVEPEIVLLLIERLKNCGDDDDVFPRGKSATIQRLQDIFAEGFWSNG